MRVNMVSCTHIKTKIIKIRVKKYVQYKIGVSWIVSLKVSFENCAWLCCTQFRFSWLSRCTINMRMQRSSTYCSVCHLSVKTSMAIGMKNNIAGCINCVLYFYKGIDLAVMVICWLITMECQTHLRGDFRWDS
jgi:hypothetical protein